MTPRVPLDDLGSTAKKIGMEQIGMEREREEEGAPQ